MFLNVIWCCPQETLEVREVPRLKFLLLFNSTSCSNFFVLAHSVPREVLWDRTLDLLSIVECTPQVCTLRCVVWQSLRGCKDLYWWFHEEGCSRGMEVWIPKAQGLDRHLAAIYLVRWFQFNATSPWQGGLVSFYSCWLHGIWLWI